MVLQTELESVTYCLEGSCSIQLSYRRFLQAYIIPDVPDSNKVQSELDAQEKISMVVSHVAGGGLTL